MKAMLTEYVEHLGEPGKLVDVAPGYLRNYLEPKKLAFRATKENIKNYENNLKQRARKIARFISEAEEQKNRIEAVGELVFIRKAGGDGKLFGSVTTSEIGEALGEKGFEIDRHKISLSHPLKHVGEATADVKIHQGVTAQVKVVIQPETVEEEKETAEATNEDKSAPDQGETATQ